MIPNGPFNRSMGVGREGRFRSLCVGRFFNGDCLYRCLRSARPQDERQR